MRGKQLTSLNHTIREGNSVTSAPALHPKAFDWQAAFPGVFAHAATMSSSATRPISGRNCWRPPSCTGSKDSRIYHGVAAMASRARGAAGVKAMLAKGRERL